MDTAGRTFVARPYQFLVSGAFTHGMALEGIGSDGSLNGSGDALMQANSVGFSTPIVFGDGHYAIRGYASRPTYTEVRIVSDAGSFLSCQGAGTDALVAFTGSPSGDLFTRFTGPPGTPPVNSTCLFGSPPWTTATGNFAAKWTAKSLVYTKQLPDVTSLMMGGNSGDLFLGGLVQPGEDLGCAPLGSPGAGYLARLDTTGQCLWSRLSLGMTPVGPTTDGGLVLTNASFQGTVDLGCGSITSAVQSTLLARFDASGACVWSRTIDVPGLGAWLFPSGEVLVSRSFSGTVDLGGGPLTSVGASDVALARLDSSGAHLWSKSFGTAGVSLSPTIFANANESVLLTGGLTGWVDFGGGPIGSMVDQVYVVKLGSDGTFLWQHPLPSGTRVLADPCGAALYATSDAVSVTVTKLAP
jgi:hypothetical protein